MILKIKDNKYKNLIEHYKKNADIGISDAMKNLGNMYFEGKGVEKNYEKAIEWYKKAIQLNNSTAMKNLGSMYRYGLGVKKIMLKL